jgi:Cd2+/Zn2+-exporting ATPase
MVFVADGPIGPGDLAAIRRRAMALPGVLDLIPGAEPRLVVVAFDPGVTRRPIVRAGMESADLRLLGAGSTGRRLLAALDPRHLAAGARAAWASEQRVPFLLLALCLLAGLVGFAVERTAGASAAIPAYAVAYVAGGAPALRTTLGSLRRGRLDVDLLMLLAAAGAAAVGAWWEGAVLLFLFSLGGVLEAFALGRTHRSVRALMDLRPDVVQVVEAGPEGRVEREVAADRVAVGALAAVRPGERVPVDGEVVAGTSAVDQSAITGESIPVEARPGDPVFAGTINLTGYLEVRVTRPAQETVLARVIALVAEARAQKAPAQRAIDRYQPVYVAGVLGVAAVAFALFLAMGRDVGDAFLQAMTLLVVASPCALVISVPASLLSALARAAREGILVKGSGPLEDLARVRTVAFDKTGTLTTGALAVTAVTPAPGVDPGHALALAAAVEAGSGHPLAQAVAQAAERAGIDVPACTAFAAVHGRGVEGDVEGRRIVVGSPAFMRERGAWGVDGGPLADAVRAADGEAALWVGEAGARAIAVVGVRDTVRTGARPALTRLRGLGVRTALLSGDRAAVAERVGREVGVDALRADLLPEDQVAAIRDLAAAGPVAMVGDGVNDAPALAAATVGIAMGVRGTDQALETADVVLMADRLDGVPDVVDLARRTRRIVTQNLVFAGSVILVLSVLAIAGVVPLPLGVVGHEGSTVIVTLNGLRLLRPPRGERRPSPPAGALAPARA